LLSPVTPRGSEAETNFSVVLIYEGRVMAEEKD